MERLSVDNISFLARNSMSLAPNKRTSQVSLLGETQSDSVHHLDDRNWSWAFLRNRFSIEDLEDLYDRYFLRIQNSYFNVYLATQGLLSLIYIVILLVFSFAFDTAIDDNPNLCNANSNLSSNNVSTFSDIIFAKLFATSSSSATSPFNDSFVVAPYHIRCNAEYAIYLSLPEIVSHGLILVACIVIYMLVYDEKLLKHEKHGRKLQIAFSLLTCFAVLFADVGLTLYYYLSINVIRTPLAFPTIILVYFFLPFPRKFHSVIVGVLVSVAHLLTSGVLHSQDQYYDAREQLRRVFAESIFYLCANGVGIYSQLMIEITIRRAFLDRRGYIKSTIKKNYEKDQEEQLLSSILPDHISKLVKEELRNAIHQFGEDHHHHHHHRKRSNVSNGSSNSSSSSRGSPFPPGQTGANISSGGRSERRRDSNSPSHRNAKNVGGRANGNGAGGVIHKKPFSDLFVERHDNVSIIFADIVNFTPLTVKLQANELVRTLNELFERFDAAATKHNCVRIKLLGDCYYAVSGIQTQTPDHAKNCVLLGFEMIEIIKEVRDALKVDINMRIGIHSGNILSGLLGIYKWQFDVWSKDVTIANHMEQCGLPGRVHVTKQTKDFLGSDLEPLCKSSELYEKQHKDKYLEENNIETYFLTPPNKCTGNINGGIGCDNCNSVSSSRSPVSSSTQHRNSQESSSPHSDHNHHIQSHENLHHHHSQDQDQHQLPSHHGSIEESTESLEEEEECDHLPDLTTPKSKYTRGHVNHNGAAITPRRNNSIGIGIPDILRKKSMRGGSFVAGSSDVLRYREMMEQVNETMKHAIDEMPLSKLELYCRPNKKNNGHKNSINMHVNPILMNFDELNSEIHYQTQPDPLFKYYLGSALFVLICIGILQVIAVRREHSILWFILAIGATFIVLLVPFVWVGYLWTQITDPHREMDVIPLPQNRFVRFFFHSSNKITASSMRRTILYLCIAILISFLAIIDVVECEYEDNRSDCKSPWLYTYSCAMAILLTYTFFRIHFLLKVVISIIALTGYGATIFYYRSYVFQAHRGGSPGLSAVNQEVFSHIIYLMGISAMLHIMDRQMEYINRLDFIWKRRLTEEHKEASLTHAVNTVLIHNILPTQIAKIYLDPHRSHDSHSRTYQNVSVMFASIPHFMDYFMDMDGELGNNGLKGLQVLNQIITEFDKALFNHVDVEKIKVIGSTYMAACGLEVQDTGRLSATSMAPADSDFTTWKDHERQRTAVNPLKRQKTLHTLVKFASDMMVRLQTVNVEKDLDFHLRVGVATGLVVAGVVGSQKPLYDIWGDTVNLASRMDSHGAPDKIQVSSDCANLLKRAHVKCDCQGTTLIKGKGNMTTYFVALDNNYRVVYDYDYNYNANSINNASGSGGTMRVPDSGSDVEHSTSTDL